MKSIDLKSTAVAGLFGAALVGLIAMCLNAGSDNETFSPWSLFPLGFIIGAGTQVGVRLVGVS